MYVFVRKDEYGEKNPHFKMWNHGTPTAETPLSVRLTIKCTVWNVETLVYYTERKSFLTEIQCWWNIPLIKSNTFERILELLHCRENFTCASPINLKKFAILEGGKRFCHQTLNSIQMWSLSNKRLTNSGEIKTSGCNRLY